MKEQYPFRVSWTSWVKANDHQEAAKKALEALKDPSLSEAIFTVAQFGGCLCTSIDLSGQDRHMTPSRALYAARDSKSN